jgi:signal transduction histidine kinase
MLSSVLRNLLINAIKFSFRGGEIRLNVNTFAQPGFLEVNIIDSGVGIQPDDMAKLFKLEYKVKQQGTAKEIGTGLGLIISSDLIKAMGGKIGVESQLGVGSRFWFLLAQP